jgi:hypothetical protein
MFEHKDFMLQKAILNGFCVIPSFSQNSNNEEIELDLIMRCITKAVKISEPPMLVNLKS